MIIVEIGLNHLGSKKILSEFLKKIPENVDGVSIQVISDEFFHNPKYSHLKLNDETLYDFINKLLLLGKKVGLAIDDHGKVGRFMPEKISFYKILSKDIENKKLIDELKKTNAESIYISTGMSDYKTLDKIVPQLVKSDKRIKLIHTQLSNSENDVNLKAIETMRDRYKTPVAYGHHCSIVNVIYASLGFLPEAIFFYIKGNENLEYPDNKHAVKIDFIKDLVDDLKSIKKSIGDGNKISMKNWA
jgi:N,N'-diacetyllegionaminate synthase